MLFSEIRLKVSDEESEYSPEIFVDKLYRYIKMLVVAKQLSSDNVAALAELTTELANRLKEEEGGEQKG